MYSIYTAYFCTVILSGFAALLSSRSPSRPSFTTLSALQEYRWKLDYFLYLLFRLEDDEGNAIDRSQKHLQMVVAVVNDSWDYTVADIVEEIYRNGAKFEYREDDELAKKYTLFSPKITTADIRHAQPGLHALGSLIGHRSHPKRISQDDQV